MFDFTPIKTKQQKDQELEKTTQPEKVVEKTSRMFDFTPIEVKKEEIVEQPKIKPVIPSLIPEKQPEFGELLFKKIETPEKSITETTKEAVPETKEVIVPEKTHPIYSFFDKMLEATTEGLNKSLERLQDILVPTNKMFEGLVKPIEKITTEAFGKAATSIPETLLDTTKRLKAFEEIQKTGVTTDEETGEQKYATKADKLGKGIEVGVGAANTAFIPITSIFSAAKEVPGLNIPVETIEWVFGKAGEIGVLGGDKLLNALPISDEDKQSLALPVAELTGLVGMIVLGGSLFKGVSKGVEVAKNKITESKPGTTEYNDAVKEILDTENTDTLMDKTMEKLKIKVEQVKEKGETITPEKAQEIVDKVNEEVLLQPAIRYSKEEFKITDDFRGGTWYTSPESKTFDFSQGFGGTIGGPIKTEKTLQIKNPLIIKNADVSEGSFALIDSGYENKLPIKERKLVQDFYEKITKEDVNDKQVNDLITKYLTEEKFSKAEIKKVIDSTNKVDATFDLIISKGLREKGYDALILENEYQGEIIDKHIFKLKEETEPEVKPKAKPKAKEEVKPEKIEEKTKEKPQDELIEVFRGETPERVSGNIIKGKTEFGDAPFVSFATDKTLASRFGDKVNTHSLKKSEILDLDLSKDQKALKIVDNEIDLSKEQVKKLNELGYKAISFNNLEPGYKGKEIRYFGDFKIEPKAEVKPEKEVVSEKDRIDALIEKEKSLTENMDKYQKEKALKGIGMEYAGYKRAIEGKPTQIEKSKARSYLESNHKGKEVEVAGKQGTLTGKVAFGSHEIQFKDGIKKFVKGENIRSEHITDKMVLDYIKDEALKKIKGKEDLYGIKPEKETKKTEEKKISKEVKQEAKVEKKTETDEVVLKPQEKDFISQKEVEAIYEGEAPIKELYHVTPLKNLKSIKEKGLITKGTTQNFEGEKRANYFTIDYEVVKGMQEKLSGDSVVLRYKTNKQPFEKGGPITDDIEANSYIYKKDIKPEKLEILTKNGWKLLVEEPRLKVETKTEKPKIPEIKKPETKEQKAKKEFQSRVYERMQAEMPDILKDDLTYERMNMEKDAEKAVKLIEKDKQEAYEVAMGLKDPTPGQTSTAVNIALTEKALEEGNNTLAAQLIKNRSLAQTRRGQEIVAEKGSISDNSVNRYVKELINARMETLKTYTFDIKKTKRKTKKQQVMEKVDKEVAKAKKKIKNKELDLEEAQKLIDSIICK